MSGIRKKFGKEYKAKVALEAVKGLKTVAELSSDYGVHANQIFKWKKDMLEQLPGIFAGRDGKDKDKDALIDRLYRQIGELQVENDWIKKKLNL